MSKLKSDKQTTEMEGKEAADALFKYATEGIIVTDKTGSILKINPSAEKMFGYAPGELLSKKIEVLIPDRFNNRHQVDRDNFNKNPHARSMGAGLNLFAKRKDGSEFPVEISLSPYEDKGNKYVIAFIVDTTLRKLAEDRLTNYSYELEQQVEKRTLIMSEAINELERTRDELNQALEKEKELNELKSRFVSMASHEFRTPLATVLSSLTLVARYGETGDKEKQDKHISRIKSSITHLTDILNDMLSISKLEEGAVSVSRESVNLREFITELLIELKMVCKPGQTISYHHEGDNKINFDKKILRHILFNLLSNAIKFSPEEAEIELSTTIKDKYFKVTVSDKGIGISPEDQKHLFERFFRGHNASNIQGTGLGLNIVAKYVEMLDGSIECESEIDKGTSFKLTFMI